MDIKDPMGSIGRARFFKKRKRGSSQLGSSLTESKELKFGDVYFAHVAGIGVKIGFSQDAGERMKSLNAGRYPSRGESLHILFASFFCAKPYDVEQRLHALLKSVRIEKELYELTLPMVVAIYYNVIVQRDPETYAFDVGVLQLSGGVLGLLGN
eukprot:1814367-Rhodomonas_salina.1